MYCAREPRRLLRPGARYEGGARCAGGPRGSAAGGPFPALLPLYSLLLALAIFLSAVPASLAKEIRLQGGISLDVPSHWHITASEGLPDAPGNEGMPAKEREQGKILLFSADSQNPSGLFVRISLLFGSDAATYGQILDMATPEILLQIGEEFLPPLAEQMRNSGVHLVHMNPLRVEAIGGRDSLVISFSKKSDDNSELWDIEQYKIPMPGYLIKVVLGVRKQEGDDLLPLLDKLKRSIVISLQPPATEAPLPGRYKTSFNCANAATPVETAICGHQDLAALDLALAGLYKTVLRKQTPSGKARLVADQRNWLLSRNTECREKDMPECLRQHYKARITALETLPGAGE